MKSKEYMLINFRREVTVALFPLPKWVKKSYISIWNMKQTRPHLQISPLGLVNKYGSKNPKTSQKQESY